MSEDHSSHKSSKRHMLMMVVCCVLPIALVFVLSSVFPNNTYLGFLALAICPLSMMLMMLPNVLSKKKKDSEKESCH